MPFSILLILIMLIALLLILIIMVQNPKGGGLSSSFGGGAQPMGGVQNTNNFLDKSTWTLAIAMIALILLSNLAIPKSGNTQNSEIEPTLNDRPEAAEESLPQLPAQEENE